MTNETGSHLTLMTTNVKFGYYSNDTYIVKQLMFESQSSIPGPWRWQSCAFKNTKLLIK